MNLFDNINKFIGIFIILGCIHDSSQEYWQNKKLINKMIETNEIKNDLYSNQQPLNGMKIQKNPWYQSHVQEVNHNTEPEPVADYHKPVKPVQPVYPMPEPVTPAYHKPVKPVQPVYPMPEPATPAYHQVEIVQPHMHNHGEAFPIQKPVLSYTGEVILENTIGGLDFNCHNMPTGHWRDPHFCDVFHACVHGYHRKTYTCPIVGHRTYFDETSQKCEFVYANPHGCTLNKYVR